jgi:uncharacterized protein YeeX (DUF496 family)
MSHLLSRIRATAKKPGPHDPKSGPKRDFDIDLDYVCELWDLQKGKCEVSGIPMTHKFNDLKAVSIDRIDSEKGHVRGNVQLVCQFVNYAKRHHSNEAIRAIIGEMQGTSDEYEDHKIVLMYLLDCNDNQWTLRMGYNWKRCDIQYVRDMNAIHVENNQRIKLFKLEDPDCHVRLFLGILVIPSITQG